MIADSSRVVRQPPGGAARGHANAGAGIKQASDHSRWRSGGSASAAIRVTSPSRRAAVRGRLVRVIKLVPVIAEVSAQLPRVTNLFNAAPPTFYDVFFPFSLAPSLSVSPRSGTTAPPIETFERQTSAGEVLLSVARLAVKGRVFYLYGCLEKDASCLRSYHFLTWELQTPTVCGSAR
ncbi:hypothetical protein EVAR_26764_1 [Eumeta japonica]|uniref:Uncharacterized protein n=1 Tax=Eumeta variegata TaxID=151549 RepID=A0A4C1XAP0_EUMVA|nr:hypothetical protein EVAR_26764_1 [Eumeta japonica]